MKNDDQCYTWNRSAFSYIKEEYNTTNFLFMYIVHVTFSLLTQNSKGEYQINCYKETMHEKFFKN